MFLWERYYKYLHQSFTHFWSTTLVQTCKAFIKCTERKIFIIRKTNYSQLLILNFPFNFIILQLSKWCDYLLGPQLRFELINRKLEAGPINFHNYQKRKLLSEIHLKHYLRLLLPFNLLTFLVSFRKSAWHHIFETAAVVV